MFVCPTLSGYCRLNRCAVRPARVCDANLLLLLLLLLLEACKTYHNRFYSAVSCYLVDRDSNKSKIENIHKELNRSIGLTSMLSC